MKLILKTVVILVLISTSLTFFASAYTCNDVRSISGDTKKFVDKAIASGEPRANGYCDKPEFVGVPTGIKFSGWKICHNHGDTSFYGDHLNAVRLVQTKYNSSTTKSITMSGSISVSQTWQTGGALGADITANYKGVGATIKAEYNWSYAKTYTNTLNFSEKVSPRKTGGVVVYFKGTESAGYAQSFFLWVGSNYKSYEVNTSRYLGYMYSQI